MVFDIYREYKLQLPKDTFVNGGKLGLVNNSRYCYLNSIIQCLASNVPLVDHLLTIQRGKTGREHTAFIILYHLIDKLYHSRVNPSTASLGKCLGNAPGIEHDSSETLLALLETIHNGIKKRVEFEIKGQVIVQSDKLLKRGFEERIRNSNNESSFIGDAFYGMFISTCNTNSEDCIKFEMYNSLLVPVGDTIDECLNLYFQDHKCSCKKGTRSTLLWDLPDTLIIVFKRFDARGNKLNSDIQYQDILDMKRWVSPLKGDSNSYIYSLYAVNYHSGSVHSGHYWSYCKDITGSWYKYDDQNVEPVRTSECKDSYILFYQRMRRVVSN